MPQTSIDPRLSMLRGRIRRPVTTSVDESPATNEPPAAWRQRWQGHIDHSLIEWGWDPSLVEDDGIDAPSRDVLSVAIRFAQEMMRSGEAPPTRVVPDPNGGIVFEREGDRSLESIRISAEGLEYCRFENARLVEHFVVADEDE